MNIPEFYAGQNVFVTGATGFIGKLLVEKLLYSCPDIGDIYILVRPRRGVSPKDRLQQYKEHVVFDRLRNVRPEDFNKVKIIPGDVAEVELGMSPEDRELVKKNVNIVFHTAASVRFDDPLVKALLLNTRGTREMVNLALEMDRLKVFTYVSTAYSNCDLLDIEEKLYEPPGDWRAMIAAAENLDRFQLDIITKKLIGNKPNTYLFSKALAEHVVNDHRDRLPAVIIRPSIVVSSKAEPMPGYVENLNGVVSISTGALTGVIKVGLADDTTCLDCIPVDITAKGLIIASWSYATGERPPACNDVPVYNLCTCNHGQLPLGECVSIVLRAAEEIPLFAVSYPSAFSTRYELLYYVFFYAIQLPHSILLDALLYLAGKKTRFVKIQRAILKATITLKRFVFQTWHFSSDRFMSMEKVIHPSDQEEFNMKLRQDDYFTSTPAILRGIRKYLLKETTTLEQNNRMIKILFVFHVLFWLSAIYLVTKFCAFYSIPHKLLSLLLRVLGVVLTIDLS